ncbi:MAG: enoyl-CoA hydratase-related protein [Syntrophomonadaceae bacterium]|nr:enoyl-CoA hydratase-related protein [Syntrophomonadaceae bacterium]
MEFQNIIYNVENEIGIITLNRPKVLNALNQELMKEVGRAVDLIAADEKVKAVILTGSKRAFAAGADIGSMVNDSAAETLLNCQIFHGVMDKLEALPKPVIAAIAGMALGGGCELAQACDIRVAAAGTKFGQPEINLGIIPGGGGTQRLPRLIGMGRAKELILMGGMIDAQEALSFGLVNKVVPLDSLMEECKKMAQKLTGKPGLALAAAKRAMDNGINTDLTTGNVIERECFSALFASEDQKEGMTAFLEKRKPVFKAR